QKSRNPFPAVERKLQEFSAGAQYFLGSMSRRHASRILGRFAERELKRHISGDSAVAVFAAGKFGERELGFRSDLDVIAFYEGDYDTAAGTVESLVKQMALQFKSDLRLRLEGRKGLLVWSPARYREYLQDRGETWDRTAMPTARFVAGKRPSASTMARRMDLAQEYEFLLDTECMLRLWSVVASTRFERKDLEALGQMLHLRDFLGNYHRITGAVRKRFEENS